VTLVTVMTMISSLERPGKQTLYILCARCAVGNAGIVGTSYRYSEHVCDVCEHKRPDWASKDRDNACPGKCASATTTANTGAVGSDTAEFGESHPH
jgi:hypothetical protein